MAEPPVVYVTINYAADWIGVSRRTIYNWMRDGRIMYVRTPGGQVRIDRDSLTRPETPRDGAAPVTE